MSNRNGPVEDEAIAWVIRLRDARPEDWEAFTRWLEADPAHAAAYDIVALADEAAGTLPPAPKPVPALHGQSRRAAAGRRQFIGWGLAVSLFAVVGLSTIDRADSTYVAETGPGEKRTVRLADGSRIDLNGGTRLVLDRDHARFASLERGEALFTVRHDDSDPFEVKAGDALLRDMGTVFNVVREGGAVEVAVAEGAVLFNPEREAVNLTPGMRLRKKGDAAPAVDRRDPRAITGWRIGELAYSSAAAAEVAADLAHNLGVAVTADPAIAGRRFTGVIRLDGDPDRVFHRAALLMGVDARRTGDGWILTGSGETS